MYYSNLVYYNNKNTLKKFYLISSFQDSPVVVIRHFGSFQVLSSAKSVQSLLKS